MIKRKRRIDKKHDIRVPVTLDEKRLIRLLALNNETSMTNYSTNLLKKGLGGMYHFPIIPYEDLPTVVHVKVTRDVYELLSTYCVDWDCSLRRAAHRILTYVLGLESEALYKERS